MTYLIRREPRSWQREAMSDVRTLASDGADRTLIFACPGAGKTLASLFIAIDLSKRVFKGRKIVVITPNEAIRSQWIRNAADLGIELQQVDKGSELLDDQLPLVETGYIISYQLITNEKNGVKYCLRRFCEAHHPIIILDEVHHSAVPHGSFGGNAWGEVIEFACMPASFKLCTTGTPFREKSEKIAFVKYDDDNIAVALVKYGYDKAIRDGVCRPIEFVMFDGFVEFTEGSERSRVEFGHDADIDQAPGGLRAVWDVNSALCREMLEHAHQRLLDVRSGPLPVDKTAGGLIVARDVEHADQLACLIGEIAGLAPVVVHSKIDDAQEAIERFRSGDQHWIVAVSMLSEGVDIQRLRVGVYATTKRTSLYVHQFCGRFARVQSDAGSALARAERSYVFMPYDPGLEAIVIDIQKFRAHALDEEPPTHVERMTLGRRGRAKRKPKLTVISSDGGVAAHILGNHVLTKGFIEQHRDWARGIRSRHPQYAHQSDYELVAIGIEFGRIEKPAEWVDLERDAS